MLRILSVVSLNSRVYPRRTPWKTSALVVLAAGVLAAGCGGGGREKTTEAMQVSGPGFSFGVPSGWQVSKAPRSVTIKPDSGPALASVTVLPLLKPYKPVLFRKTAAELDRVTAQLAAKLNGKMIAIRTIVIAGGQVRQYDLAYTRGDTGLIDRITYVLRGKSEYYLLCRWPADQGETAACGLLTSSFRLR